MAADSERAVASIFKRGGQKGEYGGEEEPPENDARKLDTHLQTLAAAWGAPKTRRGMAAAVWRPALGAFEVVNRGRQTFAGQGFMHNKKLHLNVEEAVYLLDRAVALLAIEDAHQQQQQQHQHQQAPLPMQQRLLSMQEALHMMAVLQVPADRMVVLGHLSRLGFTVKRHPACWAMPAELPANHSWQITPAWAATDGLLPLSAEQAAAAAATLRAAAAGSGGGGGGAAHNQRHQQQQEDSQLQQQQQELLLENGGGKASPEQKRRKLASQQEASKGQSAAGAAAADHDADQQQEEGDDAHANVRSWYHALPPWLQQHPPPLPQPSAADDVAAELPGVLLQLQFPLLQPLRRYRDVVRPPAPAAAPGSGSASNSALQTQQQPGRVVTADLVFDVLLNQPHFSYRAPPRPHFSVAMVRQGCSNLPPLDELLDLSAAAAGGSGSGGSNEDTDGAAASCGGAGQSASETAAAAAAAAGSGRGAQQQVAYQTVKFALPEEGDVSFCELRPVRLMNLLTNQR